MEAARTMAAGDRIAEQQYLDFLRMRGFRQSLLCRGEARKTTEWSAERLAGCYATTTAVEAEDGAFLNADQIRMTTSHPVPVEYLRRLIAARPRSVPVTPEDAHVALELFKVGILELHGTPGIATLAGEKPCASPLARYQAERGEFPVTTLWHRPLEVDGADARRMLTLLDGTRDRKALREAMNCTREMLDSELWLLGRHGLLVA
jgi:hypothetical protein